jgi:two-component system, chemotaxis family, CheB/CheR fusion protein
MDRVLRHDRMRRSSATTAYEDLTERERQVLDLLLDGQPNKNIALDLGISQKTVSTHRSHIMKKMGASGLVELARLFPTNRPS